MMADRTRGRGRTARALLLAGVAGALLLSACAGRRPADTGAAGSGDAALAGLLADPVLRELAGLQERHRLDGLDERDFTHRELWDALGPILDASGGPEREEIGRSAHGRPLYLVTYGTGPTRVLLWSQMHGDESTATMALGDLFRFLAEAPAHPLARRLAERLTVLAIPMLNPDGAERFRRRNAQGIDVNRDVRVLATPEARVLRAVHERHRPTFGFNLHDQNVRTRVGDSDRLAAISLLAPAFDEARGYDDVRARARLVAAVTARAVEPLVGGHVTRYDDTFNPRAFGDLMQSWGTSTVLIESGGWRDDPQKQHLRQTNFVAILSALDAIATGAYAAADTAWYEMLPENGRAVNDLLVLGGTVVVPGLEPWRADLAIDYERPLERTGGTIVEIGDLAAADARDTIAAAGLFVHPDTTSLRADAAGRRVLDTGIPARLSLRRGRAPDSEAVHLVGDATAATDAPALERRIRERIAQVPGQVAVALVDLETGARVMIDADVAMHAASTMKVPVLLEAFRRIDAGELDADQPIRIINEFRSIADGSVYSLSPADDSDSTLYARVGRVVPLRELLRLMIVRSSNLATNILLTIVPPPAIAATLDRIGAGGMRVLRGVEDGPAYRAGLNNTTTAAGFAAVLEAIAACDVTTEAACRAMRDILVAQEFNAMIPAGLPPGTMVAHKTGWITEIQHDGGIVYPPGRAPYVLVILTRGIADEPTVERMAADVSRLVWDALVGPGDAQREPADGTTVSVTRDG